MLTIRYLVVGAMVLFMPLQAIGLDNIPENMSGWTERGTVLQSGPSNSWEEKNVIAVAGVSKVGGIYYLFYLAGFDGCWNADGDSNHQSLGLATSTNGVSFTKYSGNPVLKPHDFLPIHSHEEGIRTGYVQYIPSKGKFYGYFGVESPGGAQTCNFGGGGSCGCNVSVDARVFLGTSSNGTNWNVEGAVGGTYFADGAETYASGWVHNGSKFGLFITRAQGGQNKSVSSGSNALSLNQLGQVPGLNFGWSGVDAYLHDDNNTITLMYEPSGGSHPGVTNDNLYFATTHLSNLTSIQNQRVVNSNGDERNIIFKDGNEWKWYYSDEPDEANNKIKLRTHPITDNEAPNAPQNLQGVPVP